MCRKIKDLSVESQDLSKIYLIEIKVVMLQANIEGYEKNVLYNAGSHQDVVENKCRKNVSFRA
jgi:hypothetical protein